MHYPSLNPIALQIGPLAIRWYALAYVAGIVLGWLYLKRLHARLPIPGLDKEALDDLISWVVLGVLLGGRLGYVLFYKPGYYLANPLHIPMLWEGGMSFHGGMIGVIAAVFLFCRKRGVEFWPLIDAAACVTPIGLFFGRLANFVNGELFGRATDAPWGMVFPHGGELPRHPSQLYEAGMEGIALFALLFVAAHFTDARRKPGFISGLFLAGYACARIVAECFREPDAFLGYLVGPLTMGQLLCLPMLALGLFLMMRARHVSARAA